MKFWVCSFGVLAVPTSLAFVAPGAINRRPQLASSQRMAKQTATLEEEEAPLPYFVSHASTVAEETTAIGAQEDTHLLGDGVSSHVRSTAGDSLGALFAIPPQIPERL